MQDHQQERKRGINQEAAAPSNLHLLALLERLLFTASVDKGIKMFEAGVFNTLRMNQALRCN